jgi:hypothetical protein
MSYGSSYEKEKQEILALWNYGSSYWVYAIVPWNHGKSPAGLVENHAVEVLQIVRLKAGPMVSNKSGSDS